jgi:hypothetical protein
VIYLEGSYVNTFSGNPHPTPYFQNGRTGSLSRIYGERSLESMFLAPVRRRHRM